MAFTITEGTPTAVVEFFGLPGGATTGYVTVSRIDLDFPGRSFSALMRIYTSQAAKDADIDNCGTMYIGTSLTLQDFVDMTQGDLRDVLYPKIQAEVLRQIAA